MDGNAPSAPSTRVPPASLSPADLTALQQSLTHQQHRRQAYQAGPLRVWWEGAERWHMDSRGDICAPFRVPLSVSALDLVGDDAEGALLVAVVPLPAPDVVAADGARHLAVTLEGGQTVAVTIALDEGTGGEARAYVIQLADAPPALVVMPGAEPSAVKALLAGPRPRAVHDGDPGKAYIHRPNIHGEAEPRASAGGS
jgi:hypothetical protein